MRVILTIVLPLLLPTLIYLLWLKAARRGGFAGGRGGPAVAWGALPWTWLVAAGVVFTSLVLAAVTIHLGERQQGVYVPPKWIDGEVVPGHLAPPGPIVPGPAAPGPAATR